jgi:hypothetical protein
MLKDWIVLSNEKPTKVESLKTNFAVQTLYRDLICDFEKKDDFYWQFPKSK